MKNAYPFKSLAAAGALATILAPAPKTHAEDARSTSMLSACGLSLAGAHMRENRYSTPAKGVPVLGLGAECDFTKLDGPGNTALVVGASAEAAKALQPILRESARLPGHMMSQDTAASVWVGARLRYELPSLFAAVPYVGAGVDYDFASLALPRSTIKDLTDRTSIKNGAKGTELNSSAFRDNTRISLFAGVKLPTFELAGTALNLRIQVEWTKTHSEVIPDRDWTDKRGTNEATVRFIISR